MPCGTTKKTHGKKESGQEQTGCEFWAHVEGDQYELNHSDPSPPFHMASSAVELVCLEEAGKPKGKPFEAR